MCRTTHLVLASLLLLPACGSDSSTPPADASGGGADADPFAPDANPTAADASLIDAVPVTDAFIPTDCVPGTTECSDCEDNDGDGVADGYDPECTSAADNDEGSFATAIPGDNIDLCLQDCFFDGNSGAGDDGCEMHTCCIIGEAACPAMCLPTYNPAMCTPSPECIATCLPATTAGCDCFGCCTICDSTGCYTVMTNPAVAPDCTYETISDPLLCPVCTQVIDCADPCDPEMCMLCPGQTPEDLPPECTGTDCGTATPCTSSADCAADQWCSAGCCIEQIG